MERKGRLPWAWMLPVGMLAVWVLVLVVPATVFYVRLVGMADGADPATLRSGGVEMQVARSGLVPLAMRFAELRAPVSMDGLNLPGVVGEVLVSMPLSWPDVWHPAAVDRGAWRAFTYPLYCLPFWWLVGLGVDGCLRQRRVAWWVAIVAVVLALLCAGLAIRLALATTSLQRDALTVHVWGLPLWAGLFSLPVVGWWRSR